MRASVIVAALAGCSGGVEFPDPGEFTVDCTGADTFVAGMEARAAVATEATEAPVTHRARLLQAEPAPPDVGDNAWILEVVDGSDTPVGGLDVQVQPFMPLHGHGLSPSTYAAADLGDGRYEVESFDLIMPGLWEFTVGMGGEGLPTETALFALCAEG